MSSVLITGVNRGLGLEFAKQYAEAGWRVYAAARATSQELAQLAERHKQLSFHQLELTNQHSVRALAHELADPIDLLLNNAGMMGVAPLVLANAFVEQVARASAS